MADRFEQGMATRRKVLGAEYVDSKLTDASSYGGAFQEFVTEGAWGTVWSRPQISHRERSMVTLALLAGLGNFEELALHTRATANTGATPEDILEVMLHVAVYAGVPRANHAMKVVKETLAEMEDGK